jgi:N-acetylmuramoyl-L-alanine amidase
MRWTSSCARAVAIGAALLLPAQRAARAEGPKQARALYDDAQASEKRLHQSEARLGKKSEWLRVARMYRNVVVQHPQSGYADDALYYEAEICLEIDRRFGDDDAAQRALDTYLLLANGYPSSKWALRARLTRGKVFLERSDTTHASIELRRVTSGWPGTTEAAEARRILDDMAKPRRAAAPESFPSGVVGVRNIRRWTGPEYTRIVIDLDREVKFQEGHVENPDRIFFDLQGAKLTKDLADRVFPVGDGFLQQIRVAQNQPDVVRVVLDLESVSTTNVFFLPDPYRMVVDIVGDASAARAHVPAHGHSPSPGTVPGPADAVVTDTVVAESSTSPDPRHDLERDRVPDRDSEVATSDPTPAPPSDQNQDPAPSSPPPNPVPSSPSSSSPPSSQRTVADAAPDVVRVPPPPREGGYSIAQQFGLSVGTIVIDAGHGGQDPGTMDKNGLREKDIVLDVARRVRKLLEKDGYEVIMTRDRDVFIPLEERTAIANSRSADLFVSIHVNAARNPRPRGTETYYLNLATTPDAEEVAARENAVTTRRIGELEGILKKVMNNNRIMESRELAARIQTSMSSGLFSSVSDERNRGVKTAPFYVLLGAQIPSVLVEVAYLTNRKDATLLGDAAFLQKAAESIARGIGGYQDSLVKTTKADASGASVAQKD